MSGCALHVSLLLAAVVSLATTSARGVVAKPNIVLILADDLRPDLVGAYGNSVYSTFHVTPHLDLLAKQGVRFDSAFAAAPLCAPSRFSLVTGHYNSRRKSFENYTRTVPPALRGIDDDGSYYYISNNGNVSGSLAQFYGPRTHGALLRQQGYRTGGVGKWHLGTSMHMETFNFSYLFGSNSAGAPTFGIALGGPDHNPEEATAQAVSFIKDSSRAQVPFFLHLAYTIPHAPFNIKSLLNEDPFTGQEPFIGEAQRDQRGLRPLQLSPERRAQVVERRQKLRDELTQKGLFAGTSKKNGEHTDTLGAVRWLDKEIGEVLEALEQAGVENSTLVVFGADHGIVQPHGHGKGSPFNEGARVPLIARWLGGGFVPGSVVRTTVSLVDLLPTFLEVAGAPSLPDLDGLSLLGMMRGHSSFGEDRSIFVESGRRSSLAIQAATQSRFPLRRLVRGTCICNRWCTASAGHSARGVGLGHTSAATSPSRMRDYGDAQQPSDLPS